MKDWTQVMPLLVALLVLVVVVGVGVLVRRRSRAYYAAHPEQVPRGRKYALRVLPFGLLALVVTVWCAFQEAWSGAVWGAAALVLFSWMLYRSLTDPSYPSRSTKG